MVDLLNKFKNSLKMNKKIVLICTMIVLLACIVTAAVVISNNNNDTAVKLSNTNGMNFSFDDEDIIPQEIDDNAQQIVLSDDTDAANNESDETKTTEIDNTEAEDTDALVDEEGADVKEATKAVDKKGTKVTSSDSEAVTADTQKEDSITSKSPVVTDTASTQKKSQTTKTTKTTTAKAQQTTQTGPSADNTDPTVETSSEITEILSGGDYVLSGTSVDRMLTIDADGETVNIILNGITMVNNAGPAIYIRAASKVIFTLNPGTVNNISDGSSYSVTDNGSVLQGAIYSKSDLTINGSGTLNVNGNYKHGIVSKDDLVISTGTVNVNSKNVGIEGKDCVKINEANVSIKAGTDAIRSDNIEDSSKGYIYISGSKIDITSQNDGIQAETVINIENTSLSIITGGGSSDTSTTVRSHKGLKSGSDTYITGGTFTIDSKDDCINSDATVTVSGGVYTLSGGDDGIHADTDVSISGDATKVNINKCYEGIEASNIVITGGNVYIISTNDGLSAAGGNDTTVTTGDEQFTSSTGKIVISGGNLSIKSSGDCLDSKGSISISGGTVKVCGPASGKPSIIDYDTTGVITGGTFIGTGSSAGATNFSGSSTQSVCMFTVGQQSAGTVIKLVDTNGNVVAEYTSEGAYSCVLLSSPNIVKGEKYKITAGTYTADITITDTVCSFN